MAWTDPVRYPNSLEITDNEAFLNTYVIDNLVYLKDSGAAPTVFTNEAARDAAITVPTEGMRAYLTAPTIPLSTGGLTITPTGVETVYNGSVWVVTTEVGSTTDGSSTFSMSGMAFGTPWTSGTGDTTSNTVQTVTGTTALVSLGVVNSSAAVGLTAFWLSVDVTGATSLSAAQSRSITGVSTSTGGGANGSFILTGLTPGTNVFTLVGVSANSGFMTAQHRFINVRGIA